jgi:hypothetical protein
MNLPSIIKDLIEVQAKFDSKAYANCFSETAIVFDENETHTGQQEIMQWNEKTNAKYQTQLEPIEFYTIDKTSILTTKVSGNFDGSPIVLKYHFELNNGQIDALKITG